MAARAVLSLLRDKIRSEDIRKEASILLSAHGMEFPSGILTSRKNYRRMNVCKCCDLTPTEFGVLHSAHRVATPNISPPPWTLMRKNFTSALIRFSNRKDMEETITNHPQICSLSRKTYSEIRQSRWTTSKTCSFKKSRTKSSLMLARTLHCGSIRNGETLVILC
jgi:hypothetical protein